MKEKAVFIEPAKVTPFRANSKCSYSFHYLPCPCNTPQLTALSTSSEIAATAGIFRLEKIFHSSKISHSHFT